MSEISEDQPVERIDADRWFSIKYQASERQIGAVFQSFRERKIEPILIKGWAASLKYPRPYERYYSDIDLAVAPEDYLQSLELVKRQTRVTIDIHKSLRHLDTLDWKKLFDNSRLIGEGTQAVRVLSEEDHLRVLAVHWLQDGGAYRQKLWDIYYAVANRSENFSWEQCLGAVAEKRALWIIYTIGLAHRYLDLDLTDLPFRREAQEIPVWLSKAVEKEWNSTVRLTPLNVVLNDRKELIRQILKRIPPNPIQATIESDGHFNNSPRIYYQAKSVLMRLRPSIERLGEVWRNRQAGKNGDDQ